MRRARRKLHRAGSIAGSGNDSEASLLCRDDALLDDGRAALAAKAEAGDVDTGRNAVVERCDQVAASRVSGKPADMQLALRRVTVDAVGGNRNGTDDAGARRAMSDDVLC